MIIVRFGRGFGPNQLEYEKLCGKNEINKKNINKCVDLN